VLLCSCSAPQPTLHCVAGADNDIVKILQPNYKLIIHQTPKEAVTQAREGEAILLLAFQYPDEKLELNDTIYNIILEKGLRVFIEYPSFLPGIEIGESVHNPYQRAVVNSSFFGEEVDSMDILAINGMEYCRVNNQVSHIVAARVAGFHEAEYVLPEETSPLLLE